LKEVDLFNQKDFNMNVTLWAFPCNVHKAYSSKTLLSNLQLQIFN